MERIAPSARLEAQIEDLLGDELAANGEKLAELGRLGARLVLQRAVEDEVTAFLGRARYQRTPEAAGSRNGTRSKRVQTAEGEISVDMPQVRGTAAQFISRVFPDSRTVIRTRPLEALIIGGYVRGLSDRDIESLMQEAGLGQVSKSTASRICRELRARYKAFCARSLAEVELLALFLDAIYLPTRPSGEKEGVLVAWGYTTQGLFTTYFGAKLSPAQIEVLAVDVMAAQADRRTRPGAHTCVPDSERVQGRTDER